jgi:hypothetical protein
MPSEWTPLKVTYRCQPGPPEGKLYLPKGSTRIARMIVKDNAGQEILVYGGVRVDEGDYACATGDTIASLGGLDADIEYRRATFWDVLRYKPWLWLQILITLATFVSAVIAGYATYLKTIADPANTFAYETATVSLALTFFLAAGKLIVEFRNVK